MEKKDSLLIEFSAEAIELLNNAENVILRLEKSYDDNVKPGDEDVNSLFRCFHTIKGTSGFLHLPNIVRVTHEAESLLDLFRGHTDQIKFDFAGDIFLVCDELKKGFKHIGIHLSDKDIEKSVLEVTELLKQRLKAVNESLALNAIPNTKKDLIKPPDKLIDKNTNAKLKERFGFFDNNEPEKSGNVEEKGAPIVSVPENNLNSLDIFQSKEIKISTEKLDQLLDLVGELVIAEETVASHPELNSVKLDSFYDASRHLHKIVKELQELMLLTRVLPLSTVFQRLNRVVRDLQKISGKKINFEMVGEEYEVDKSILEWIADPLVHLLRNAIDHGIETPAERIKAGKSEAGHIKLQAIQTGNEVWIKVTDDGRGLDSDKILQKAVEKGIVDSSLNLNEVEIFNLIFFPGLSTSGNVTEISGRGVGMDIVKQNINRLNGRIDVSSQKGSGTRFNMRIPLLTGIMEGTVFRIGNVYFALQTIEIQELVKLEGLIQNEFGDDLLMVNIRNQHIPVFEISNIIDLSADLIGQSEPDLLIVIEYEKEKIGLKVDSILGNHSLIIKPVGKLLSGANGISGFSILGNGNVSIILDVKSIYDFFIKKSREVEQSYNTTIGKLLEEKKEVLIS